MNKIYKLVWSKVRNAWVVTSEIAKGHGKDSSSGRNKNMLKAGVVMTLLGGFMTAGIFPVAAELTADQKAVYDAVMEEMNQKVADSAVKYYGVNDTAVSDTELGWEHIVIYDGKKELNADLPDKNIHGEGVQDNKGDGVKRPNYGSMAAGYNAYTSHGFSTALGNETVAYTNSLAAGFASYARAESVALGVNAFAKNRSEAIGQYARADQEAIAIGYKATAGAFNRGEQTDKLPQSITGIAIGKEAYARGGMAFGNGAESLELHAMAFGVNAKSVGSGVALGYQAQANVSGGIAIGMNSRADVGRNIKGYLAPADIDGKAAAEKRTWISGGSAVSFGNIQMARQLTNVAAGTEDTDAVNVAQLKALNTKVDNGAIHYFHVNSDDKNAPEGTNYNNDGATGKDAIAIGKNAVSEGDGSIAIGKGAKIFNTSQSLGMAIGDGAEAAHGSIVIGKNAKDYDTNPKQGAFGIFIGSQAKSFGGSSQTVIGNYGQAKGEDSTAIGTRAQALGGESLAVGSSAKSLGQGAASFGTDSIAEFDESTAVGSYANGRGNRSVASGNKSVAAGHNSVAIGYQSFAHNGFIDEDEYKALSPEEQKKYFEASGLDGYFLKDTADGNDAEKIGDTYLNTAVGSYSRAYKQGTTLGGMTSAQEEGTAIGTYAKAYKKGAASLGYKAKANVENGVALGAYSFADREKGSIGYVLGGDNSTLEKALESIGQKEKYDELTGKIDPLKDEYNGLLKAYQDAPAKSAEETTAKQKLDEWKANHPDFLPAVQAKKQMTDAWQSGNGAVSVGRAGATRQITNVAAGTQDTDAVNVAQLKALNTKMDQGAIHYYSVKSDDSANPAGTNWNNDGATGQDAVAIGKNAAASGKSAFATGWKSKAAGYSDIAIGREAEATGGWGVAIGQSAKAQASTAVAMAYAAEAKGANSLAIGVQSEAKTNDSTAYGREAKALGDVALAVGAKTKAEGNHSSVFGYEATTDSTAWNGTAIGRGAYIGKQAADGTTPDVGVSNNYYTPVDDDTAVEAGKETMNSTAVGFGAKSFGYQNTALGAGAEAFDTNTVAVGVMSKAIGHYANAFGKQARAEGTNSTAIGHFARALGESSMALGDYAITSTLDGKGKVNRSVALGSHARVAADNSLALGYNSLANIADDVDTEAYLSKEAFKKENGVVSVGNSEYTIGDETIAQNYRRITNVAGGAADNDAVNVAQLKVVNKKADQNATDITNLKNTVNANGKATKVTVDGEENSQDGNLKIKKTDTDGQLTYDLSLNDEITIGKDGKDGKIGINGKDGISADITVGKGEAGVDGKDGITRIIYKDEKGNHHEVATLDDGLKFKGDAGDVVIRKLNTQLDIKGGAKAEDLSDDNIGVVGTAGDNGGMAVKLSKKLKGLTSAEFKDGDNITNITAENVTITRKEGKVDLWELNKTVNNITAGTTDVSSWKLQANGANERVIKKDSVVNFKNGTNTEVTVNGNDITVDLNAATQKQINDNTTSINNIDKRVTTIENNIDQKIEGARITVEGDTTTGVKATEVKTGDKVTGYKVSLDNKVTVGNVAIDGKDGKGEITGLTNTTVDAADFATKGRAATEEQLKAAMGKVQAQGRTTVKGSNNITVTPKTPNAAEYTVELAKDISVNSVTANEYKVGGTTYINKDGINANGKKITNVADGVVSKDSKDAVNGSQLFATNQQVFNNMNQINNLREESREGDALGAAMAALKPLDFDPYQRSQIMAGVGYYRGKEAVALGLAHYKNEDLMFHGGIAYAGNSDLMANVGVSYRFGSKDDRDIKHDRNLRMPQYAEGPISSVYILQDEVDRLTKENKEANDRIAALEAKLEKVLEKVK